MNHIAYDYSSSDEIERRIHQLATECGVKVLEMALLGDQQVSSQLVRTTGMSFEGRLQQLTAFMQALSVMKQPFRIQEPHVLPTSQERKSKRLCFMLQALCPRADAA